MPTEIRDVGEIAVAFSRVLRGAGVAVPTSATIGFTEALALVGLQERSGVYWAGRSTLIRRPEDHDTYDRAFEVFWDHVTSDGLGPPDEETIEITIATDDDDNADQGGADGDDDDSPTIELRFSATEILRQKDFADYTDEELIEAQVLMSRLRLLAAPRRSRRLVPTRRQTSRHDIARTMKAAIRADGEPMRRKFLRQGVRNRRLVLILDVSGSMEPYARALLRFVQAAVAGRQKVEAFALGTRLTRLTRELASRDPDEALRNAARRVLDYGGGTRLGEGLRAFNDRWGQRGMARGAIVVVLSDGWDRGDPDTLVEQMQRLHRAAHTLIWVNPLKVTPGYAPLARGMAAALPHVDHFVEGHSVAAIDELARVIAR